MAAPTAEDIVRIFGTPGQDSYRASVSNQLDALKTTSLPQPNINTGVATQPTGQNFQGVTPPPAGTPLAPPAFPRPPSTPPQLPSGGPTGAPVQGTNLPAPSPVSGGQFQPTQYEPEFDPELQQILRERMRGEGVGPGFQEIVEGTYSPYANLVDTAFDDAAEQQARDLARRGILSGGEAARALGDLENRRFQQKAQLAGQLALDFENNRQENITNALQQFAGLEQGRVQAKTQITTANIGASAQVQSASIMASAQVRSATASANAQVASARIAAQASLQRSGMDFDLAMRQFDNEFIMQGIDPVRLETDPVYRGDVIAYNAFVTNSKNELINAQTQALYGIGVPQA